MKKTIKQISVCIECPYFQGEMDEWCVFYDKEIFMKTSYEKRKIYKPEFCKVIKIITEEKK